MDKIQITIDALESEYNRIKNYEDFDDAFSVVMQNIRLCLEADLPIRVRINFDPDRMEVAVKTMEYLNKNFGHYKNIKVYFAPIDEDDHIVRNITNSFMNYDEHPYIKLIKYGRAHGLYRGFPDMEYDEYNQEFDSYGLLKKLKIYPQPINCYAACQNVFSIDCNGKLYKCHRGLGRDEYASGDVFSGVEKNDIYNFFAILSFVWRSVMSVRFSQFVKADVKLMQGFFRGKAAVCHPKR